MIHFYFMIILLGSCSHLENRMMFADLDEPFFVPNRHFPTVSGDEAQNPSSSRRELVARLPAGSSEKAELMELQALADEENRLEKSQPEGLRLHYQRFKHKFRNDSERIYFLKIPNIAQREQFLKAKGYYSESVSAHKMEKYERNFHRHREPDPVLYHNMERKDVLQSFGRPHQTQTNGSPFFGNERWLYHMPNGEVRAIYFEGGKVAGWSEKPKESLK